MSNGWFASLGWWDQHAAYEKFDEYRNNPVNGNLNHAIESALPIIRVVFSTKKVKVTRAGDEDDLISSAAFTLTKALPKIAQKPVEKIGNDKQYMRYLFTCVINSFYRELEVLHGKPNKIQRRITEEKRYPKVKSKVAEVEASMMLERFPNFLFEQARTQIRFTDERKIQACEYVLRQLIAGREVAKSVLSMLGCSDKEFYTRYCAGLLKAVFRDIRRVNGVATLNSSESFHVGSGFDDPSGFDGEGLISALLSGQNIETDQFEETW